MNPAPAPADDIAALAKGGRTSFFGFLLRLAARFPFLFIAGRWYGADALGRFAYATIVIEFAAMLATLGLKRGLAQQLSRSERPHVCDVWDALLMGWTTSLIPIALLIAVPEILFPNSEINGFDRLLPLTIFGWVGSDIALAALAYRGDVAATVKARSLIEPWTISIAAFALAFYSMRDGLILAYVLATVAALVASLIPLARTYGWPSGWRPEPQRLFRMALNNLPLAGADAVEWGSRRLDIAVLGWFYSPAIVGIYYVAQQVASLPQKLKTTFDPILGPVIAQKLAEGNKAAVARQVRQVGFWIIAAQVGVALALAIPGEAVMGLLGSAFVGATGALAILLAAEAVAATAVVSEAALVYIAPKRNLLISITTITLQLILSIGFVYALKWLLPALEQAGWLALIEGDSGQIPLSERITAAGPAAALLVALGFASIVKSRLLCRLLGERVSGWRWALVHAAAIAIVVGWLFTRLPASLEWVELAIGIPAILAAYGWMIWMRGFTHEDRTLFRRHPPLKDPTSPPQPTAAPPAH